jgi:hypothetical protein
MLPVDFQEHCAGQVGPHWELQLVLHFQLQCPQQNLLSSVDVVFAPKNCAATPLNKPNNLIHITEEGTIPNFTNPITCHHLWFSGIQNSDVTPEWLQWKYVQTQTWSFHFRWSSVEEDSLFRAIFSPAIMLDEMSQDTDGPGFWTGVILRTKRVRWRPGLAGQLGSRCRCLRFFPSTSTPLISCTNSVQLVSKTSFP